MNNQQQGKPNVAQRLRHFLRVPALTRKGAIAPPLPRRIIVESLEPRFLLSGEGLVLPPAPPKPALFDTSLQASLLSSAQLVSQIGVTSAPYVFDAVDSAPVSKINEVIFLDPGVKDGQALVRQALANRPDAQAEVVLLDGETDGVQQMTTWLKQHQGLQAVHIISHGDTAAIKLGSAELDAANIDQYQSALTQWQQALAPGADLLLYGCDVAQGKDGAAFVERLAQLTGADVAASTDATGSAALGGDWILEKTTGLVASPSLFVVAPSYDQLLAAVTVAKAGDTSTVISANGAFTAASNLGAQLDANAEFTYTMPLVDLSFSGLIRTNDGRTLGDVLAFKTLTNTTVLDDYLATSSSHTMGGLMDRMGDYLNGMGAYSNLESVVDHSGSAINFSATGQVLTATLTLSREFIQQFGFGEQLKALGLDFQGGQGIPLLADVHFTGVYDFANGTLGVSQLDAQVKAKSSTFSAGMALGVIAATATGTLEFDTGKVEFNAIAASGASVIKLPTSSSFTAADNLFTVKSGSTHAVKTNASFDIAGDLGGTPLATIAGGTPHINVSFGGLSLTSVVTNAADPVITGTASLLAGQTLEVTVAGATYTVVPASDGTWSLALGTASHTGTLDLGSGIAYDVLAQVVKTSGGITVSSATGTIMVNPTINAVSSHTLTPTLSGVARLATGQTLSVAVGGAVYSVIPAASGAWTLNLAVLGTSTKTSGTLLLTTGNNYPVVATVSGGIPTVSAQLTVNTALTATTTTPATTTSTNGITTTGSVTWNALQPAPLTLTSTNFSNLQAFSSLTSTQLVKMLQDLGTYLDLLRDSGKFDAVLPFTDLKLGNALDFSAAINDVIDNQLATTIRSGMTASKAVSPVLGSDVVFDLQVQRPGDERITTLAIAVAKSETTSFTHINQLAMLIGQKITTAVNGWLVWTGSMVDVSESLQGGLTVSGSTKTNEEQTLSVHASSGTYQLNLGGSGTATGDISVLATPVELQNALEAVVGIGNVLVTGRAKHYLVNFVGTKAGTNVAALTVASSSLTAGSLIDVTASEFATGSDGKTWGKINLLQANPGDFSVFRVAPSSGISVQQIAAGDPTTEAVQRLFVIHGGDGSFILKGASDAFATGPISVNGLDATAAQNAILSALNAKSIGTIGGWVSEVSADYAADNGTRVFDIGFGKTGVTFATQGVMTADVTTASVAIVQTTAGDESNNAVQTLTISKTRAGVYALKGTTAAGAAFTTSALSYSASAGDIQTALRSAVGLSTLNVSESSGVFTVTFEKKNYTKMTAANLWTSQVPAQAVLSTQQVAAAAVGATAAKNEIQRLSISNATGGTFVLGTTLDSLLFQTGNVAYGASATDVQASLVSMLQKWNAAVTSDDVAVTKIGNVYDIEFKGRWAAKDVPQLRINSRALISSAGISYAALDNLGFLAAGQDSQVNNVTTFVTLDDMMERFKQAVNVSLSGASFAITPTFDSATKSFLFTVKFAPTQTKAVPLAVNGNIGDLSSLQTDTSLDLITQTLFQGTIGLDFSNLNTFALRASGTYTGTITASASNKTLTGWSSAWLGLYGDAPFNIAFNGEGYDLKLLQSAVDSNTTRDQLVADLQAVFAAQTVTPGGVLARRGFANLGQVVTVGKKTDGQLILTINAPVDQVQLTMSPPSNSILNAMDYLLGFKTTPSYPAPKAVTLPVNGQLTADAHFSLKVDQSSAIAVTITNASTSTNATTSDLILDINAALNGTAVNAYLSGKGFTNLGQVIQATLRNGQIELVTQSAKIASFQMQIDGADTATRELGFTPGQFATTSGAYVFLKDVSLGGNYSAVIHGQSGVTPGTLATAGQATLGMLDITFGKLATDYQGSLSFDLKNGLTGALHDRISLNDLFDSASSQDSLLGLGGTLSTSDTVSSPNVPYQSNGQLLRDVGLSVTVGSAVLEVVVKKSDTTSNTSVADLASDVNAAIHTALVARFTADPYSAFTFVAADSISVAGKTVLKFSAPTTTLTLASTSTQIYTASSGVLLVDLPLTVTLSTGATVDVLVRASSTSANTSLAELVIDVDNTIKLALASARSNTIDTAVLAAIDSLLGATNLVGQSGTGSSAVLSLKSDTVAARAITLKNLAVAGRLLKDDFSTSPVFLNQAGTVGTTPTAALTFSDIGITTPVGITATGLDAATTITVSVTNTAAALAGTGVQASSVVVPSNGLGSLTPLKAIAWSDLQSDMSQLGSLLGDLGGVGAFGELGRALPVLGSSVSDLFDFTTRFAAIDTTLGAQTGIGLNGLQAALGTAFGISASTVTLAYDSTNNALNINVPYRVVIDKTAQIELILNDAALLALLSTADKQTLTDLLGSMSRLKDSDSNALLNLHADMTFHLAMGVDLSSGANQGKLFLYDHVEAGAAGFAGDAGTYATLDAFSASGSGMAFSSIQGIYSLGVTGGTASLTVANTSGVMLDSDAKDGAADGRLYLRPYSAMSSADSTALKHSNFDVIFDGAASVVLPLTLSVSDDLGQLAMTQIDGFINPLPLGKMEINFLNLGDTFAQMGGKTGFALQSMAESSNSRTVISSQVKQAALPERPSTGNGSAVATPEGAPVDSIDESGLANVNPNPYFGSMEGVGASTTPTSTTVDATKLFGAAGGTNASSTGFDVSLIIPDFAYWQTQLTHVLNAAVGSSCEPEKIINGPLIFLLRDPSIIVDTVDKVLGGIQQGLDAFSSVLSLPVIGDQLKEATQFVADLRTNVVGAIKQALDSAIDVYGGLDNALRMSLFNMLTTDTNGNNIIDAGEISANPFLNFLQDYNGDKLVTPDDIVVEYVAGTGQPTMDSRLAAYMGVTQTGITYEKKWKNADGSKMIDPITLVQKVTTETIPVPAVLPGQRTAWVTSGINVPKLDTLGVAMLHDDGTPCYVGEAGNIVLDSSLQKIVDDISGTIDSVAATASDLLANVTTNYGSGFTASATAFAEFVIAKVAAGYDYSHLLKDVFGTGVIAASLSDVAKTFKPSSSAVAADAAVLKYNLDHNLTGTAAKIPKAVLGEFKKAIQTKAETIGAQLALGSSTAIQFRMHLGQTYTPNLNLSFDVGVPGLSLTMNGGIGLTLDWDLYLGFGVDIKDGFYVVTNMPGTAGIGEITTLTTAGVATGTVVNSSDAHIDNLWLVGKPTFTPAVKELQASIDVVLTPSSGNTAASLNAQLFVLNGTLTDNWDGWIKDNDTGIWGSGTDSLGRLTGTQNANYGRTTEMFNGLSGAEGSRTRLHLDFSVDLKDVGLFGISALSGLTNGRLTYSDLRNAKLADLYKVEWDAQAQINLHMGLGVSAGGEGYLPKIIGDFHLTWQDSNKNKYVKQIEQYFTSGYDKLFHAGTPNIWMTDVYLDVGTFFTKFLNPIVSVIQDVTDPIMPVIDALTTPVPGLSDLMGRDYSVIDLASEMSAMFGGVSKVDFIIAVVNLLDVIDSLPTNTAGMLLPVKEALIVSGTKDRKLNLSALPSIPNLPNIDVPITLPYLQMADVNVAKDGFEFGLNMGVGWKDNLATMGVDEGKTSLLKVVQGQMPDLRFDFSLTADAKIPAPYIDVTPFNFTIPGIKNREGTADATFKLNIKAGWPDLRLSDILSGNMAPRFELTLELPDIDFTPNLLPVLKFVMPKLEATVNGTTHTLLGGGEITVDWPNAVQGFVNSADVKTYTLPTASINLGSLPDFLLPLPYVDLTPIDISADLGFAAGSFQLNIKAGWKDLWLSDFLSGNIAPSFDATITANASLNINTAILPVVQVQLPKMTWTMGAKTWTWAAGSTQTIAWPDSLSGFVNTSNVKTINLTGASFDVNLGSISGFLPTIKVEWPDVHWVGIGKEFIWKQTASTDLGWSSIISDSGILSALIDPAKTITIKLPDVWLPSVNLLDLLPDIDWSFSLPGLPSLPSIDISLPSIDVPGQQTISPQQGFADFQKKLKKPGSALKFPILDDTVGSVIGLLMGKPVDLMTFTPPNLEVKVGFRVSFPIYPPLYVGIGGEIKLQASLTLGFDTYGITKFANSHNITDIFDGFYVSDNIVNGVDKPEVTLTAKLYAFAELNAFIVRGGVEGGIKLVGTLDIYDEDKDNKFRASQIIAAVSEDPLDVVEMHLRGSAYISAYVDVFALFDYVRVWEWTFMDVTLFEWEHDPAAKKPILASMDGSNLTLHMGSTIGSIDGESSVDKGAADRKRRSTDDGNESYALTGSGGTVNISATLTNGSTYTKTFSGVNRVKAFTGAGDDLVDASALDRSVLFIAGGGTDILIGGSADDVLIGSDSGTATLIGGGGNDKLIARGGTTHMQGGLGDDTYRFLTGWSIADITDTNGSNILDFTAQVNAVTLDDSVAKAFQGANRVTWTNGSDKIDLVKGGSGSDILDFSGDAANLIVSVTGTNAGWVKGSGSGMTQTSFASTTAQAMKDAGDNAGFGFKFTGFENAIGGQGSDVFRLSAGASLTGSMRGDTTAGLHHDASGNEAANARNILDFSEYITGVVVNEESTSAFGTANATGIIVRGFHDIFGGAGGDRLSGDGRNNLLVGNDGTDLLEGKAAHDLLVADTFVTYKNLTGSQTRPTTLTNVTDYLTLQTVGVGEFGAASRNWIWKGQTLENKSLTTAGAQTLKGGSGNDIIIGSKGGDIINIGGSGEGNDTILADLGKLEIDFNYRTALSATSFGVSGGNDTIYLGSGNNLVLAGNGKDTVYGSDVAGSFNIILADNGTVKFKTAEASTLSGTKLTFATVHGLTHLLDTTDAPVSENGGTGGADVVSLASGSAIVIGGAGNDVISFNASTSTGVNVRFVAGDHASIKTDLHGGITEFFTLDTLANTGGDDIIVIGSKADLATRHLGTNFILGGMGVDTIIVSGAIDAAGVITRGLARSEDVILGDNGKITRTISVATTSTQNRMLKVESTQTTNGQGGNDKIIVANGGKVIIGGVGNDTITAQNGDNLVIGDNGLIDFDASNSGILRQMQSTALDQGGIDTITLENGFKTVIAGFGADIISILASNLGDAIGPITVTGLAGVTGSTDQRRGRSGRYVAGDNALIDFDETGGLTDIVTTDTVTATGDADTIVIGLTGAINNTVDIGTNMVLGGMGADSITVLGVGAIGTSFDTILGDNGEVHRNDNTGKRLTETATGVAYALRDVHSTQIDLGGNDAIAAANGDKVIVGGWGQDVVTIDTASVSTRFIGGDNATLSFDTTGGLTDLVTMDVVSTTGDNDTIVVGHAVATLNTVDIGTNIIAGGMGADTITVLGVGATGTSFDTILGDNGEVHRNDNTGKRLTETATGVAYALRDVHSTQIDLGGNDMISAANGDKVLLGGFGADTLTVRTNSKSIRLETGDNGEITFDTQGGMTDLLTLDAESATGGSDTITIESTAGAADLGLNVVAAGMGSDVILMDGATYDALVTKKLTGGTDTSEDILIGDNGEVHRTTASTATGMKNLMLQVKSIRPDRGGDDLIGAGNGGKVIVGGLGADKITAVDGDKLVFGDNAQVDYDVAAQNGLLRMAQNIELTLGGADTIRLGEGFTVAMAGIGADLIDINASKAGFMTAGYGNVTGFNATPTETATETELRRQTGRFLTGDNAIIRLDTKAGITDFDSIDVISATGGDDTIIVGKLDTPNNLGYQVIYGGMGSDNITVRATSSSEDIIFGDNAQYRRRALSYQPVSFTSMLADKGGDDRIVSGSGYKTVVGGFGNDQINLATVMTVGETTPSNRSLILGDSGVVNFDFSGSGSLKTVESLSFNFGGSDVATVGDGDVTFIGGYGTDTLTVNSNQKAFRAAAGDNARFTYSSSGSTLAAVSDPAGLTGMISLDTTSITGDSDVMRLGPTGSISGEMGMALMIGGMGRDTLRVTGASADQVTLAGDNAEIIRSAGRSGLVTSFFSLLPEQGAGDTLETVSGVTQVAGVDTVTGSYLLVGGQGGDTIRAGSGYGVVFGDSGRATFSAIGKVQFAASVGTAQGGNDLIALGSGSGGVKSDGDMVVIGGYGSDTIDVASVRGNGAFIERTIAGDNASINFDSAGRLTAFATQDPDASTGGGDTITISMAGSPLSNNPIWDSNIVAGGAGNDTVQIFGGARSHDVLAGDNLDYRRSDSATGYKDLFAEVLQPSNGGDDTIRTGSGFKLILGGLGADHIDTQTQVGDTNLIFGDAGAVMFDPSGSGKLMQLVSTATSQGGNDTLNVGAGKDYVFGGFGNDAIALNAGDSVVRTIFGDNGQIDFDLISGAMAMLQSTGSDLADATSTADSLTLPSAGTNLVIGGTGLDTLSGSSGVNHALTRIPGSGSIQNPESSGRVISIIMLGKNGEFGITGPIGSTDYVSVGAGTDTGTGTGTGTEGTTNGNNGSAVGTGSVQEDTTLTATGRLAYKALTGGYANFVAQANQVGSFGTLTLLADGNWTYTLSKTQDNVQGLKSGDIRTDTFIAATTDGSSTTVTINVSGKDDVAVIGGVTLGSLVEDVTSPLLIANGELTVTDPDAGQALFSSTVTPMIGALGTMTISDTGTWEYRIANSAVQYLGAGQRKDETFTVASLDGTATQLVTVTLTGVNDAPTGSVSISISGDGVLAQGKTLTASNTLADADGIPSSGAGAISYQWYRNGALVSGATGASYTLTQADTGAGMSVVASYTDLQGTPQTVTGSITGTTANVNDLADITGDNIQNGLLAAGQVVEDVAVNVEGNLVLNGSIQIADLDVGEARFRTTVLAVGAVMGELSLSADGHWAYKVKNAAVQSINGGDKAIDTFIVTSMDGSASLIVKVTIVGVNETPVFVQTPTALSSSTQSTGSASSFGSFVASSSSGLESVTPMQASSSTATLGEDSQTQSVQQQMPGSSLATAGQSGAFFKAVASIAVAAPASIPAASPFWNSNLVDQPLLASGNVENSNSAGGGSSPTTTNPGSASSNNVQTPATQGQSAPVEQPAVETPPVEPKEPAEPSAMTPALGAAMLGLTGLQGGRISWDKPKVQPLKRKVDKFGRMALSSLKRAA